MYININLDKVLLISGTNRPDSYTEVISANLARISDKQGLVHHFSLEEINRFPWVHDFMYEGKEMPQSWITLQEELFIPKQNWIWVLPEYNGSIPGIVKLFIDIFSVRRAKETFQGKKMGLIGVSTGRAGNLRGLDHMTSVLNHMDAEVMPFKLPVSSVHTLVDDKGLVKPELESSLHNFYNRFKIFTENH